MITLVLDASALSEFLIGSRSGRQVADMLTRSGVDVHLPELCLVETISVIRKWVQRNDVTAARGRQALDDLVDFPATRWSAEPLLRRIWELRDNFSAYDATYVALADALDGSLVAGDGRLAMAIAEHEACHVHQIG